MVPLTLRVQDEVAAGDLGDRLDDGLDVGVDEVERDRILRGRRHLRVRREREKGGQQEGRSACQAGRESASSAGCGMRMARCDGR